MGTDKYHIQVSSAKSAKSCAVPSVEAGDEDQLLAKQAAVTSDATGDEGVSLVEQAVMV